LFSDGQHSHPQRRIDPFKEEAMTASKTPLVAGQWRKTDKGMSS